MQKIPVSVVITDLDNTLFDWFSFWHRSFSAMFAEILRISGLNEELLLDQIRSVHQAHGTAEYAFLIDEIPVLRDAHGENADLSEIYHSAIAAYRDARSRHLRLYPQVEDTLLKMRASGTLIVAYTESMGFYSNDRLRRLNLAGLIGVLYFPVDHALPLDLPDLRKYPASHYELKNTEHRFTPAGELKPNPGVLTTIISDVGARREATVYVGDSLTKDIAMAQEAGVLDAFAEYGVAHATEEYELLRRVTHWTPEQVERERLTSNKDVTPSYVLTTGFHELGELFDFVEHHPVNGAPDV